MDHQQAMEEIAQRIRGLRESCDVTVEEMASDLGVDTATYEQWEETGADVLVSAIYHMAHKFDVDLTEILTGTAAKLDTYHVVRKGEGKEIDRYPGYYYEDMAWRYRNKVMQPLLVELDPSDEPAKLVSHAGQEFNFVIEGSIVVTFDDKDIVLDEWDSIYFNPTHMHGQRCHGSKPAKFITVIME